MGIVPLAKITPVDREVSCSHLLNPLWIIIVMGDIAEGMSGLDNDYYLTSWLIVDN
jgi:hypothetical protein